LQVISSAALSTSSFSVFLVLSNRVYPANNLKVHYLQFRFYFLCLFVCILQNMMYPASILLAFASSRRPPTTPFSDTHLR
jgi:hypothetical protein